MNNKVKFLRGTSNEYTVAEKDNDTIYFTTDDGKLYIGDKEVSGDGSITIDNTLSDTSENPVQNKVIKQAIDNKADKSLYGDTTINIGRKAGSVVGAYSTAEGHETTANGMASHAEGSNYNSSGSVLSDRTVTVVEGPYFDPVSVDYTISGSTAHGINSHAEGTQSFAHGYSSHAEGNSTTASGDYSHAEGGSTTASSYFSHAEGSETTASGESSHAEGGATIASGSCSHAEGNSTTASGSYSHAGGNHTKALHNNEVAYGKYNESNDNTLFSIGDGTADDARHNAFEITTNGGKLHDKDIAVDVANPNLLINSDFKINQRAVSGTFSDAGKYFVDRWKLDSGTVTVHTNGTLTLNGTMSQILENAAGTDVTASVSAGAAAYDDSTKTFTITGDGAVISWVKLERGGIATAFVPPDPAMEQMKCYRFFYRVGGKGIANPNDLSNSNRIAYHTGVNVWVSAIFQFPVEMRVVPTTKITGTPWCFKELYSTKSDVAGEFNMDLGIGVVITAETSGYEIRMITDYLRTLKTPDGYVGPSNSTGYTDFDAEIY